MERKTRRCSLRESIKALEADIHHANSLVAALPREIAGDVVQMRLSFSPFAPFVLFILEWMDYSRLDTFLSCLGILHILVYKVYIDGMPVASPEERKATLREFYAVIYPMLKQLEGNLVGFPDDNLKTTKVSDLDDNKRPSADSERDDECGICMEMDCKVVLPICTHSMCIGCFNDWYTRSQSCPFCRGTLKTVKSNDLWVLTSNSDVVDSVTLAKDNLRRFYLYIEKLPRMMSDDSLLMYNYLM
ncbi:putative E3 ubiquitin ligase [Handroanthus impetiginosus]|uniref:Putative E3 ubiquitin ligase n=1 Tax=Handroanthus impetiginosus TaxID=429701 RepID=A0A2G9GW87_9LAMI|nr:putative E3 ubiquitin ligase [Handroanthus impetiginosus]